MLFLLLEAMTSGSKRWASRLYSDSKAQRLWFCSVAVSRFSRAYLMCWMWVAAPLLFRD